MSTTVGAHSGAGPLSLMSCVRESSPLQDYEPDIEKNVVSKRKFWNPKKWFRKKQKTGDDTAVHSHHQQPRDADGSRSRSTGELSTNEEPPRNHEVLNSSSMHPGLSVSHDSVFHPLNSGSSDLELDGAQSSSSLSISQPLGDAKLQTELSSRLRLRRGRGDTSEDDEGLPRSPPCGSPAAPIDSFLILEKTVNNKDLPTKSHSTCSDGSLLSMDSSEMDEDSIGFQSRHSSKVSLNEKRTETDPELELGPSFSITPLNHSAAHHRVSVRPKRTYGAPRRKKGQLSSALPATPEVNEDSSIRSISPESVTTEPITELYSCTARSVHKTTSISQEVKLKCNSLPAGATPPTSESFFRLNRSKSNAGKSQDDGNLHSEYREEKLSLFERLFPRRSGKKKKKEDTRDSREANIVEEEKSSKMEIDGDTRTSISKEKKVIQVHSSTPTILETHTETKTITSSHSHTRPVVAPRTGAAARQRIHPIDIPEMPEVVHSSSHAIPISPLSPERSFSPGTSPIQLELENLLRHRQMATSPKEPSLVTSPQTPKPSLSSREHASSYATKTIYSESRLSSEDIRNKIKIAGLSSLQQRVLNHNNSPDENDSFKSLIEAPKQPAKSLSKSHSFKNQKKPHEEVEKVTEVRRKSVIKASSLDSVKNLDEPTVLKSELKLTLQPTQTSVNTENVAEMEEIDITAEKSHPEIVSHSYKQKGGTTSDVNNVKSQEEDDVKPKIETTDSSTTFSSTFEEYRGNTEPVATVPKAFSTSSITISGPSHTAVVNVTSKSEDFSKTISAIESEVTDKDGSKKILHKESQWSVTKIQLKHETTQVTKSSVILPKPEVPEFLNKQLNKVEAKPASNIVFSMKSPKISPEDPSPTTRPKTFNFPPTDIVSNGKFITPLPRKFSKEDVEIIEKTETKENNDNSSIKTPPTQNRFRKNDSRPSSRKSSVISVSPDSPPMKDYIKDHTLKTRSISLDSLKTEEKADINPLDNSSQNSLEKRTEGVVLRRKSFARQKNEEEPELMKVFARRSLKLKDSDVEQIQEAIADEQRQRDSDKENNTENTPTSEKKPVDVKEEKSATLIENNLGTKAALKEEVKPHKQPLTEIRKVPEILKTVAKEEADVQLRRNLNNNLFLATQRAASLNNPKTVVTDFHVKKQASLNEKRRTDTWINSFVKGGVTQETVKSTESSEVITVSEERKTEMNKVSQRRAEWEKRAQQAQK